VTWWKKLSALCEPSQCSESTIRHFSRTSASIYAVAYRSKGLELKTARMHCIANERCIDCLPLTPALHWDNFIIVMPGNFAGRVVLTCLGLLWKLRTDDVSVSLA